MTSVVAPVTLSNHHNSRGVWRAIDTRYTHTNQQKGTMGIDRILAEVRPEQPTGYPEYDLTSPACAYRGAQWLDTVRPEWPLLVTQPIRLLTFNQCILGQVFKAEVAEDSKPEGYLYAKMRYEHEWNKLMPWWMTTPESDYYRSTAGIYLGFKGNVGCEIAWVKEISVRKGGLLQKELGL